MYEVERSNWCRLLLGESDIDELVDAVPTGAVNDDDASEVLVDVELSDALLFDEIKDTRATRRLAMKTGLRECRSYDLLCSLFRTKKPENAEDSSVRDAARHLRLPSPNVVDFRSM